MRGVQAGVWQCGKHAFSLDEPVVMGILNVTPDSFSDGGRYLSYEDAIAHALELHADGAHIIDVGGESTRPGALPVSPREELERILPVVRELTSVGLCVSVDTRRAAVARACVEAGASVINDVSGLRDAQMREVACACDAGLVVMHMAGEPATMQDAPHYEDVVAEVREYLVGRAHLLEQMGVAPERICIDPGVGFGKTTEHNVVLINQLDELADEGYPVMAAVSRKRFIGELYGAPEPAERTWGSIAMAVRAVERGARVLRVHDVSQAVEALGCLRHPARRAMVALGANLGQRVEALAAACAHIDALPYTQVVRMSSIYGSEAAYTTDQPSFANAVAEVGTRLEPHVLLAELQRLERGAGRQRGTHNMPRPLDLDIVDYTGVTLAEPQLTLPHPRVLERDFVVTPLLEISEGYVLANGIPVTREHVAHGAVTGVLAPPPAGREVPQLALGEIRRQLDARGGECAYHLYGGGVTTSTNDEARALAGAHAPDRSICLATKQTAGRGRLGRTWVSPPGGLYLSMVCRIGRGRARGAGDAAQKEAPAAAPDIRRVPTLALVGGMAVLRAVRSLGVSAAQLKWPNDILVGEGKLCGINVEMEWDAEQPVPVVGIGINVNRDAGAFERSVFLSDACGHLMLEDVAAAVIAELCDAYGRWKDAGMSFAPFADEYRTSLSLLGQEVTVRTVDGTEIASGLVSGVDDEGRLIVGSTPVVAGEVTLRA